MIVAALVVLMTFNNRATGLQNDAEKAGAGLGLIFSLGVLTAVWFVPTAGAAIIGFMLKKQTIIETGPSSDSAAPISRFRILGGWPGLVGVSFIGLAAVAVEAVHQRTRLNITHGPAVSSTQSLSVQTPVSSSPDSSTDFPHWELSKFTNDMDGSETAMLSYKDFQGATLSVDCLERKQLGVLFQWNRALENSRVRIKYGLSKPVSEVWLGTPDHQTIGPRDSLAFARRLSKTDAVEIEVEDLQFGPVTHEFSMKDFEPQLHEVLGACGRSL
jgi:hypothetical protein